MIYKEAFRLRIGIPIVKDDGLESEISGHFGRAEYFIIVDLKKLDEKKVIRDDNVGSLVSETSVIRNLMEHACGSLVDLLMNSKVDALIVEGIGGRPFQLFKQNGIKVYAGAFGTIKEVLRDFLNGMLQELQAGSCGHHDQHPFH